MQITTTDKNLHRLFLISLVIKAFDGFTEILAALALLIFSTTTLDNLFVRLAWGELLEDPKDALVNYLQQMFEHLSLSTQKFAGLYILAHGLLNMFLVIGIYKEKLWVYWVAIACISMFIVYQLYRLSHAFSPFLVGLTLFDALFIFLTWHEYKFHKARLYKLN